MKYAVWNLKPEIDNYLSGPEAIIAQNGGQAEASAWASGIIEDGAAILGYVNGEFEVDLSSWNYREISQVEALNFCQAINETAFLLEDGRISSAIELQA